MKDVFVVIYATEKGNYGKVKGAFVKEELSWQPRDLDFGEVTDMLCHSVYMKILKSMKNDK